MLLAGVEETGEAGYLSDEAALAGGEALDAEGHVGFNPPGGGAFVADDLLDEGGMGENFCRHGTPFASLHGPSGGRWGSAIW